MVHGGRCRGITVVAPDCRCRPRVPSSSSLEAVKRFSAVYGSNAMRRSRHLLVFSRTGTQMPPSSWSPDFDGVQESKGTDRIASARGSASGKALENNDLPEEASCSGDRPDDCAGPRRRFAERHKLLYANNKIAPDFWRRRWCNAIAGLVQLVPGPPLHRVRSSASTSSGPGKPRPTPSFSPGPSWPLPPNRKSSPACL